MSSLTPAPAARSQAAARAGVHEQAGQTLSRADSVTASEHEEILSAPPDRPLHTPFVMPRPGGQDASMVAWFAIILSFFLIPFSEITAQPIQDFVQSGPKTVYSTLTQFPTTTVLVIIATTVWLLDVRRRGAVVYLAVAVGAVTIVLEPLKRILGRARPEISILRSEEIPERVALLAEQYPAVRSITEALGKDVWLLFTSDRPWFSDAFASFPSGHAMTAFVIAAFLCALYPQGRWLWLLLAAGCALARVRARRHFLEDVLFSAGTGWLLACWVFTWAWVGRLAGMVSARWSRSRSESD